MNEQLQDYARKTIKEGLAKLTEQSRKVFAKTYGYPGLNSIDEIVDNMSADKLDGAMTQVSSSLKGLS